MREALYRFVIRVDGKRVETIVAHTIWEAEDRFSSQHPSLHKYRIEARQYKPQTI
tara:strand:- start:1448 stop:1612 length:165 start_codon:yes stop_codon:yes gene_type:complete